MSLVSLYVDMCVIFNPSVKILDSVNGSIFPRFYANYPKDIYPAEN